MRKGQNKNVASSLLIDLLIPVVVAGYVANYFSIPEKTIADHILCVVVVLLAALAVIFQNFLADKFIALLFWLKKGEKTYESIKMTIRYLDPNGSKVFFERIDSISNIKAKDDIEPVRFEQEGNIIRDEISTLNGTVSFLETTNKKVLLFHYDVESVRQNRRAVCCFTVEDSYTEGEEFMIFAAQNFCKFYKLSICIPKPKRIVSARLFSRKIEGELELSSSDAKNWIEVNKARILHRYSHLEESITLYVDDLTRNDEYKIVWKVL